MTLGTTINSIVDDGNGVTTAFAFPFLVPAASDLVVVYVSPAGQPTVLLPTQYAVAGVGNPTGGTVTYPLSGSPIAPGSSITIERIVPLIQSTSLSNQGPTFAAIEAELDYQMMAIQQVSNNQTLSLTGNISDPAGLIYAAPPVAARALQVVGWDASGNVIATQVTAGDLVSSAMQPVVAAATLPIARAAMGVASVTNISTAGGLIPLNGGYYVSTGAMTVNLPLTSGVSDQFCFGVNARAGAIKLQPEPFDSINGAAEGQALTIPIGESAFLTTDGNGNWTIWFGQSSSTASAQIFVYSGTLSSTYTTGPGIYRLDRMVWGAGGGGGYGAAGYTGGGGGGSGWFVDSIATSPGTTYTFFVAGGGTGGTASVSASAGGTSYFGSAEAFGGGAGASGTASQGVGGNGGTASGTASISGQSGSTGQSASTLFFGGQGGGAFGFGMGQMSVNVAGPPGWGFGVGGNGGANGANGGMGANGLIIVTPRAL